MMNRPLPFLIIAVVIATAAAVASGEVTRTRVALRELAAKAASGDAEALYHLARLYDTGYDSIPVDSARSTALYRLAADKGSSRARNYLGYRYFKGEYVKRDVDSALFWIEKAAGDGDLGAANNLGFLFAEGDAVERDYGKAVYWLKKASDGGMPLAASQLADLYRLGHGVAADTLTAVGLYERAIDGGVADAELKLISMMKDSWRGLPPDSAVNLGVRYYTHRAPSSGVELFRIAAESDNPDALALLGDASSKGRGTPYDHDASVEYYLRAAMAGHASAQFVVAELLDMFPDALPDSLRSSLSDSEATASYWYGKAAEAGITDAREAERRLFRQIH